MSENPSSIEAVLAGHSPEYTICECALGAHVAMVGCECGQWDDSGSESHAAHVAAAIREHLLSEAVVERAGRAINRADDAALAENNFGTLCATYDEQARAAVTAATTERTDRD